ncbi:unnamed protein product [Thelazia callipaeda]|uniref:F-box only protein 28 n=1 Tax=Thelazia callipaeda TaxID=103827 RepID=A0A0N5CLW6_THECL|nr:unnamed protein product [Thelazia callipaeda]
MSGMLGLLFCCILLQVSKKFDSIARSILNSSFFRLGDQLDKAMCRVKKMLPKRESQRRLHGLSRVSEVYSALETRYALLSMTFRKYIDNNSCCFIAGKLLDEGFAVLGILDSCVKRKVQPSEPQELLKDIRDYSSMAMEYFEEQIVPFLSVDNPVNLFHRTPNRYSFESLSKSFSLPITNEKYDRISNDFNFDLLHPLSSDLLMFSFQSLYTSPSSTPVIGSRTNSMSLADSVGDSKIKQWKKKIDDRVKRNEQIIAEQDRIIREQSKAINNIVECLQQISSKISFTFMKELETVEELSYPGSQYLNVHDKRRCLRKRKLSTRMTNTSAKKSA